MKALSTIIFLTILSSLSSALNIEGIWQLHGMDAQKGSYSGVLEVRQNPQGGFNIIRAVNFDTFKFRTYSIQELWTGQGQLDVNSNTLTLNFSLKKADFLKSVNGETRSPEDFKTTISITKTFVFNGEVGNSKNESLSSPTPIGTQPIWFDQRQKIYTQGNYLTSPARALWNAKIQPIVDWYRAMPETIPWREQADFKSGAQYMVLDPTDFGFYQSYPNYLRVINKQIDQISLVETLSKRNAYAPSLLEKAQHYDQDMQQLHINSLGMISYSLHDAQGNFTGYLEDGDGGLWTGMYAASQAMRFSVTKDPVAYENFKKSLNGLLLMIEVTGMPTQFARTVRPLQPGEAVPQGWNLGAAPYQNMVWLPNGNNDMYKGMISGLIWAYNIVPRSETALWQRMTADAIKLVEMDVAKAQQNSPPALGVAALFTHNPVYLDRYVRAYLYASTQSGLIDAESGLYYGGVVDGSGVNLGMMSVINDILIAQTMARDFHYKAPWQRPYDERDIVKDSTLSLMKAWNNYSTLRRDFLTIAAYTFASRYVDITKAGVNPTYWQQMLPVSIWGLREIPITRNEYTVEYDHSLRADFCLSSWPYEPWKSVKEKKDFNYHKQSTQSYPSFEGLGFGSTMHWKESIFHVGLSYSNQFRSSGNDYLFAYWVARYSGLINETTR